MNQRIKELAEESGIPQYVAANNKYLERFAESIVAECAEQVKNLRVNDYGISGAEIIKEHFGVKE